jgi:hypothetical protein
MRVSEAKRLARLSEWRQIVANQKASGLSVRGWCEQNDMSEQQFYYRLRQVREAVLDAIEPVADVQLVRLADFRPTDATQSVQHEGSIVIRCGAISVEFPHGVDMRRIASFVRALEP